MFARLNWLGIGLCAAVSLAGTTSYGNPTTISFADCSQTTLGVNCANKDAGTSQITYSTGGLSVTATGFLNPVPPSTTNNGREDLYLKNPVPANPSETGLGTVIDTADHEITDMDFVNFDFSNLNNHGIKSALLTLQSLQPGEGYKICQGSSLTGLGSMGSNCKMGFETGTTLAATITISWGLDNLNPHKDDMFGIQGFSTTNVSGPDVLVQGMTFNTPSPTPEPASFLLFGTGVASVIAKARRRRAKQQTATA